MSAPVLATTLNNNSILRNAFPVGSLINITSKHPTALIESGGQEWLKAGYMTTWDSSYESFLKSTLFKASDITKDTTTKTLDYVNTYGISFFPQGTSKFFQMSNNTAGVYRIYDITDPNDISTVTYSEESLTLDDTNGRCRIESIVDSSTCIYHTTNQGLGTIIKTSNTPYSFSNRGIQVNLEADFGISSISDICVRGYTLFVLSEDSIYTFKINAYSNSVLDISLEGSTILGEDGYSFVVNSNKTRGYVYSGWSGQTIYEYTILGNEWVYTGNSIAPTDMNSSCKISLSPDETKLFGVSDASTGILVQYSTNASDYIVNSTSDQSSNGISTYMRIK